MLRAQDVLGIPQMDVLVSASERIWRSQKLGAIEGNTEEHDERQLFMRVNVV